MSTHPVNQTPQFQSFGIGRALSVLGTIWVGVLLCGIIALIAIADAMYVGIVIIVLGTIFCLVSFIRLIIAKSKVLRDQEVSIWNGLAKLISWNPTEGVVFLKNKQIDVVDDNVLDGGGIRVIYPLFGEELVLRIPLEIQTLSFKDSEVLTKEYMPLSIQGTIYWKVYNLRLFYLYVSKELHTVTDTGDHTVSIPTQRPQFEVAEQWLRSMAEEKTRTIVSRIGTGLLISDQLASDLPRNAPEIAGLLPAPGSSSAYRSATDSLANTIKGEFETSVRQYGIEIHRVALQEVKLPAEIYHAAVEACKSAYLPLKARAEALERKMKLQAEADVIGKDAVGLKEIAGNIPALAFQDFLAPLFLDFGRRRSLGLGTNQNSIIAPELPKPQQMQAAELPQQRAKSQQQDQFCSDCGAKLEVNSRFCPNCGVAQ